MFIEQIKENVSNNIRIKNFRTWQVMHKFVPMNSKC